MDRSPWGVSLRGGSPSPESSPSRRAPTPRGALTTSWQERTPGRECGGGGGRSGLASEPHAPRLLRAPPGDTSRQRLSAASVTDKGDTHGVRQARHSRHHLTLSFCSVKRGQGAVERSCPSPATLPRPDRPAGPLARAASVSSSVQQGWGPGGAHERVCMSERVKIQSQTT